MDDQAFHSAAIDAFLDGGLFEAIVDLDRVAGIIAGHNINLNHHYDNRLQYEKEPDFMDPLLALTGLDTDHAGSISEALGIRGPIYTVGAACASANTALRAAIDEIRSHDMDMALVTAAVLDFSPVELHAMARRVDRARPLNVCELRVMTFFSGISSSKSRMNRFSSKAMK